MNRVYRVVFNRNSGQSQAVSELATSCSGRKKLVNLAVASALALTTTVALAGGGGGGGGEYTNYTDSIGTVAGANGAGGTGASSGGATVELGGTGGAVGGTGNQSVFDLIGSEVKGSAGANSNKGGAGGGGTGFVATSEININSSVTLSGGNGGVGASGYDFTDPSPDPANPGAYKAAYLGNKAVIRGGGGGGAAGLVTSFNVTNNGTIKGGNGGTGATGGGAGVGILAQGSTITNTGTITGGNGGQGNIVAFIRYGDTAKTITNQGNGNVTPDNTQNFLGQSYTTRVGSGGEGEGGAAGGRRTTGDTNTTSDDVVFGKHTVAGAGAAAIAGSNLTIINSGSLHGGKKGLRSTDDGAVLTYLPGTPPGSSPSFIPYLKTYNPSIEAVDGQAVWFKAGTNKLVLKDGSDILGAIQTDSGATLLTILESGTITGNLDFTGLGATTIQFFEGEILGNAENQSVTFPADMAAPASVNITGDLVLNQNSILRFRLDDRGGDNVSDMLNVNGKVYANNATLDLLPMYDIFAQAVTRAVGSAIDYTVLSATGGIEGSFTTQDKGFWFMDLTANTVGSDLVITLTKTAEIIDAPPVVPPVPEPEPVDPNAPSLASYIYTNNQGRMARALYDLGTTNPNDPLYMSLMGLSTNQDLGQALDYLTGEMHPTIRTAMKHKVLSRFDTEFDRMHYNYDANVDAEDIPMWLDIGTSKQQLSDKNYQGAANIRTNSFMFGADKDFGGFRLGASAGFETGNFDIDSRASTANTDTWKLGLFGGSMYEMGDNKLIVSAGLGWETTNVESGRYVFLDSLKGVNEHVKDQYDIDTISLVTEAGYEIPVSEDFRVQPFVGLAHYSFSTDSIYEYSSNKPANDKVITALSTGNVNENVTSTKLGTKVFNRYQMGSATGLLDAQLAWRHNFGDTDSSNTMAFRNGTKFRVDGISLDENAILVGAGATIDVGDALKLGLRYKGEFGSNVEDNSANVNLRWIF